MIAGPKGDAVKTEGEMGNTWTTVFNKRDGVIVINGRRIRRELKLRD